MKKAKEPKENYHTPADMFCPVRIQNSFLHQLNHGDIPVENLRLRTSRGPTVPELLKPGDEILVEFTGGRGYSGEYKVHCRRTVKSVVGPFSRDGDYVYPEHYTILTVGGGLTNEVIGVNGQIVHLFADSDLVVRILEKHVEKTSGCPGLGL